MIAGDRKREWFPTAEARAQLVRFRNRARTGCAADRVPAVAILFHKFFPSGRNENQAATEALALAQLSGFDANNVFASRAYDARQLRSRLFDLGFSDPISTREPESFLDALQMFGKQYESDAVVSQAAFDSAARWSYPRPSEVLADICAIHRIYGQWRKKDGTIILDPRDRKLTLQSERGCELAPENREIHQTHRTLYFSEIEATVCFHLHRKYSFNFTRIYFWFARGSSDDQVRTLIAHAGEHLPDGSDNDR